MPSVGLTLLGAAHGIGGTRSISDWFADGLKATMAFHEAKRTTADAAQYEAEQGHQHLEDECQGLHSTCSGKFFFTHVGS